MSVATFWTRYQGEGGALQGATLRQDACELVRAFVTPPGRWRVLVAILVDLWHVGAMSLRKPGRGTRQPHGRGMQLSCALARVLIHHQPKCRATKRNGEPCRKVALSGTPFCGNHGGFALLAKRGLYRSGGNANRY